MSEMSEPEALLVFMDGLAKAASAANTLAHMQQRPAWLHVRDLLEGVRTKGTQLATMSPTPRKDVLEQLERRRKMHVVR